VNVESVSPLRPADSSTPPATFVVLERALQDVRQKKPARETPHALPRLLFLRRRFQRSQQQRGLSLKLSAGAYRKSFSSWGEKAPRNSVWMWTGRYRVVHSNASTVWHVFRRRDLPTSSHTNVLEFAIRLRQVVEARL